MSRKILQEGPRGVIRLNLNDMTEELYQKAEAIELALEGTGQSPKLATPSVSVSNPTANSIDLLWNNVPNAQAYLIFVSTTTNDFASANFLAFVDGLSYQHSGLNSSTSHYYFVIARAKEYLESENGTAIGVTTGGASQLATPSITIEDVTSTTIDVSWAFITNATNYDVYINTVNNLGTATLVVNQSSNTRQFTGLTPETAYYIFVVAKGAGYTNSAAGLANDTTAAEGAQLYDIYLDSSRADDTGDGLTEETAKKTVAGITPLLGTGIKLAVKRGSVFKEELVLNYNNIKVFAYGEGDNPLFDATDNVPNGNITKSSGYTNVYEFQATAISEGGVITPFPTYENRVLMRRASSIADCDTKPGSYYAGSTLTSGVAQTVYIHASASENPITNGKAYDVSTRDCGIDSIGASLTLNDMDAFGGNQKDGTIRLGGSGTTANRCTAWWGNLHSFFIGDGCTLNDCVCDGTYGGDSMFIGYKNTGVGTIGILFNRCTAIGTPPINQSPNGIGWHSHTGDSTAFLKVVMHECHGENLNSAYGAFADSVEITRCTTKAVGTAVVGNGYLPVLVERCFFDQRTGDSNIRSINESRPMIGINDKLTIKGCVFVLDPQAWGYLGMGTGGVQNGDKVHVTLEYNTFACVNPDENFSGIKVTAADGLVVANHNIFYGFNDQIVSDWTALNVTSENNVYYRSSGTKKWRELDTWYESFTSWKTTGNDANGSSADPVFTNNPATWLTIEDAVPTAVTATSISAGATFYEVEEP